MLVGLFNLWAEKQGRGFPSTTMFTNFVYIIVWGIGLMIILDSLNIAITPILTALGVGGLAISLALKDTLSDVFSGLHILLSGKVQPGDFAELDSGERGYISNITWRNTTMLERTNNIINIPNSRLSTAIRGSIFFDGGHQKVCVIFFEFGFKGVCSLQYSKPWCQTAFGLSLLSLKTLKPLCIL